VPRADGRIGLVIADVAGKGIPAALIMATFRALLRAQIEASGGLAQAVAGVNRLLRDSAATRTFVTCSYAVLEPSSGVLAYTNCGHPPPLLLRRGGEIEELGNCGPVLGVFPEAAFGERRIDLAPGDRLLFYTDGLVEARNRDGEEFGLERLKGELLARRRAPASRLTEDLVQSVRAFVAAPNLADDLTLIALERRNGR
jgi:phosphoserine phosphatase RsbU/P